MKPLQFDRGFAQIRMPMRQAITTHYFDTSYTYMNLFKNPSLENGLWQRQVQDCFAYDLNPILDMKVQTEDKTKGAKSLELDATSHIACTGPPSIAVKPGEHYLLEFDYRSVTKRSVGYYVSFDGSDMPAYDERLDPKDSGWHHFSRVVTIPNKTHSLRLMVYGYPNDGVRAGVSRYDNFSAYKVPNIQARIYAVGNRSNQLRVPQKLAYDIVDPTKKVVHITHASQPFILATNDSYHGLWELYQAGQRVEQSKHFALNNLSNAWLVQPAEICAGNARCPKNADGTYDMTLTIEFAPQRYFYAGLAVSGVTVLLSLLYLVITRDKKRGLWHVKN
jgi:hypothetical protein